MPFISELSIILTTAVCTFLTRLFPFALFGRHQEPPAIIRYLGYVLPSSVIAILIIYCIRDIDVTLISSFAPKFIAIALVGALHVWKRNNLISIGVGTVAYMLLVQIVFK